MKKRKITRGICLIYTLGWLFYITIKFLMGKASNFSIICMFIGYSLWIFLLILKIREKVEEYKTYKCLVNCFEHLQTVHKELYKLYFTGDREKIEQCSTEFKEKGILLIEICKLFTSNNLLSKKHIESIEKMTNQTEKLMETIN